MDRRHLTPVQTAPPARGAAALPLPRPQAHLRNPAAHERGSPEDSPKTPGSLHHSDHTRYLLTRPAQHGRCGGRDDKRGPRLKPGCSNGASTEESESINLPAICRNFRRGGTEIRTRDTTIFSPPTSVTTRFSVLRIWLVQAECIANDCPTFLRVARSVVSAVVSMLGTSGRRNVYARFPYVVMWPQLSRGS